MNVMVTYDKIVCYQLLTINSMLIPTNLFGVILEIE